MVLQHFLQAQEKDRVVKREVKNTHNQRFGEGINHIEKALQRLFQRKIHDEGKIEG
nr:hypothetical protein [Enhydrobacter aerosaccus]